MRWHNVKRVSGPQTHLNTRRGSGIAPRQRPMPARIRRWFPRVDVAALLGNGGTRWRR